MKDSLNIAIAGATGYVGLELINILSKHPNANIKYLCAQISLGKRIYLFDKRLKKKLPRISKISDINWKIIDIIFTALPNGEAQKIANQIPSHVKLIDLSADFRLKKFQDFKKYYKISHKSKNLIKKSVYSITEFSRQKLPNNQIISCPGCYPTSVQIPIIPLIEKNMINTNAIIIDSKSGYSGGGKNIKKKHNVKNLLNSVSAYGVGSHRHMVEIDQELSLVAKKKVTVSFTPHVVPMFRGILSTIYLQTSNKTKSIEIYNYLKKYHKKNLFVKIAKFNKPISTSDVINTNYCIISVCNNRKNGKIIILSAIDNLIKGAAGQAVQNMNAAYNINETTGLI